jgi:hypothetical protein
MTRCDDGHGLWLALGEGTGLSKGMRSAYGSFMRHVVISVFGSVVCMSVLVGCPQKQEPTAKDGVSYLGLAAGQTRAYADGDLEETHSYGSSNVAAADGITVDVIAKDNGGFVVQSRSLTVEVTPTTSFLRRFNDCVNPCAQPEDPIAFLDWPLEPGAQKETETEVVLTENGTETGRQSQRHSVVVGDEGEVTVPAGSYDAFSVTWTLNVEGSIETHLLSVAADEGIVKWVTPDGKSLELK